MFNELCLYLELWLYLAGTLLYGFLTRELFRRPEVLPENWPLRALVVCLTVWYGGTLIDHLVPMLFGWPFDSMPDFWTRPGVAIDLIRAFAWLFSFSFLAHTLAHILNNSLQSSAAYSRFRLVGLTPWLAYPSLALFIAPAWRFALAGNALLGPTTQGAFPQVAIHGIWTLALAGGLALQLRRTLEDRRMVDFLRGLAVVLGFLVGLMALGYFFDPWSSAARGGERFLRTLLLGGLLLPGGLFAFFVQRYNLLRLSLSHQTLRHFLTVLVLVSLVMLAGPAVGLGDLVVFRRFVAWGLLVALFLGSIYMPLMKAALRRSSTLRRLSGNNVTPQELDRLMDHIQNLNLGEDQALAQTAGELGRWLGSQAQFLPGPSQDPGLEPFWSHFAHTESPMVHRLDPPNPALASLLSRQKLHAVFALRIENRLTGLLGLTSSATGGGYDEGELEAVRLVMRQLAATLALRRLMDTRLQAERRQVDQERLEMLGLISASLAHEIKNPLSSMKALAQALREDLAIENPRSEGVEDLDLIVEQIDRLNQTTQEILGVARPQRGEQADLTALVRSTLYVLQAEARRHAIELSGDNIQEVGPVRGSAAQLSAAQWQTITFNLMLNAIQHTPAGGTAEVVLKTEAQGIVFETINPGPPLSDEQRQRIFEPFVSHGGTGLGLALVSRRVRDIGGSVQVHHRQGRVVFRVLVATTSSEE